VGAIDPGGGDWQNCVERKALVILMRAALLAGFSLLFLAAPGPRPAQAQLVLTPPAQQQQQSQPQQPRRQVTEEERRRRAEEERRRRQGQAAQQQQGADGAPPQGNFPRRLTPREIRDQFFDGRPVRARGLGNQLFTMVFHADGRMERTDARGDRVEGRWRFLADNYCSRWQNGGETCHTLVTDGTNVRVVRNTRAVAVWSRGEGPLPPP
jgi:hypothetical protein